MMQHIREQLKLEEGRKEGRDLEKVMLIKKKMQKSKSVEVIANELECEVEDIRELYEGIQHCGIDCELEEVMDYLNAKIKNRSSH